MRSRFCGPLLLRVLQDSQTRSHLITYTNNGRGELSDKAYAMFGSIPPHMRISTWYAFILQHFVRPYQAHLHPTRVSTINFKRGRTARFVKRGQTAYSFSSPDRLRLDKVTDFACLLIEATNGLPIERFVRTCDHLYIDEAQDLSGYDLELVTCAPSSLQLCTESLGLNLWR
jgi:DNA helicase-2/ATP-dependent DNA helicase PcrA